MSIEAMKQALEALLEINELSKGENAICLPAEIDGAMDALRTAIEAAGKQEPVQDQLAWQNLRNRIQADIDRTEGRWGMHGHSAVDNDYFTALEWVVERIDEILASAHRQPLIDVQWLEDAYLAGFMNSDEGHNGEYPFRYREENPLEDRRWVAAKNAYISAAIAAAKGEA